jgi:hypothetical protein
LSVAVAAKVTVAPDDDVAAAVIGAGSVRRGAVVSRTVTLNEADPLLLLASVAAHVTDVVPMTNVLPDAGAHVAARLPETMSIADAEKVTAAPDEPVASAVIGPGTVTTGFVVSPTVTVNEAEPVLPAPSMAVQVTVVAPMANVEPDAGAHVAARLPETVSAADVEKETVAPAGPAASAMTGAGMVTAGGVVSPTVTVNELVPVFPAASAAVQVTLVVPRGNTDPEAGRQAAARLPATASVAPAGKLTVAPDAPVASTAIGAGTVTTGGVVSPTVTVTLVCPVLPL